MAKTINLGDMERTLRYDLNAIAEIGDRLDIKIRLSHIGEDLLQTPLPLKAVRTILWAGVLHERPDITETEVGSWVDHENFMGVVTHFFELFSVTSPALRERMTANLEGAAAGG